MSEQDEGRLFPESPEVASELGTTYDESGKLVPLPKPTNEIDLSDAEIKLPSE